MAIGKFQRMDPTRVDITRTNFIMASKALSFFVFAFWGYCYYSFSYDFLTFLHEVQLCSCRIILNILQDHATIYWLYIYVSNGNEINDLPHKVCSSGILSGLSGG